MRLLKAVDGSVLWLLEGTAASAGNLRREAAARGVAPERLVFASRVDPESHLARHRLADLFLDTLPYNAHTSTSDALWTGLPVLTCLGTTFAGRVAGSLVKAVGLSDLVATSIADYEALALKIARDPALLASIKARLAESRLTEPLFDTARSARDIESAFTMMVERQRNGLPPATFAVETRN
jgi:protein O-GlcNAc transferase